MTDLTPAEKEQAIAEFGNQFEQELESRLEPYQGFIPIGIAVMMLGILMTAISLLSLLPVLVLKGIFSILTASQVTTEVTEIQKVTRPTLE